MPDKIGTIFLFIMLLCLLYETGIAIYFFTHADKVNCNLLFCTFINSKEKFAQECYENGIQVDCDKLGLNNPFGDGTPFTSQDWEYACMKRGVKVKTISGAWVNCTGNKVIWS